MEMDEYLKARTAIQAAHNKACDSRSSADIADLTLAIALNGLHTAPREGTPLPRPIAGFIALPQEDGSDVLSYIFPADQLSN